MASILVVDDTPANRDLLSSILSYDGHSVIEARDGSEGLGKVREAAPDLVIADILMPTMDGFELVRRLREDPATAGIPVVFYTAAYREQEVRRLARACGIVHILTKPSAPEEVVRVAREALGLAPTVLAPVPVADFDREHQRVLTDKLLQKIAELEAVTGRLAAVVEAGRDLASERDLDRLIDRLCHAARKILGASAAAAGLLADDGRTVDRYFVRGYGEETAARMTLPAADTELIRALLDQGAPLRRSNPGGDPAALGLPADHPPVSSFLGVPLASGSRVYGWLGLRNKLGDADFSDEDERLAGSLAAQAAVALENILRYREIERHAEELERRVEERTESLRRSNAELEQFASVASHDLQEPLRKITGFADLLAARFAGQLGAEGNEFLGYVTGAARRMRELIQDLLTYSRLGRQAQTLESVDCGGLLRVVLQDLSAAITDGGARVTHDPLPTVVADRRQLGQLFQNLLSNAVKFRGARPPEVHVGAAPEGGGWRFSVRDNGIGIAPEYGDRIFRVFQRLHNREEYAGTGIGLAICKAVVERHGGRIWVESRPGEGATFLFTLPDRAPIETGREASGDPR